MKMDKDQVVGKVKDILRENHPGDALPDDMKLLSDGGLDSIELFQLVDDLERAFEIEIAPDYLSAEFFDTPEDIAGLVNRIRTEENA